MNGYTISAVTCGATAPPPKAFLWLEPFPLFQLLLARVLLRYTPNRKPFLNVLAAQGHLISSSIAPPPPWAYKFLKIIAVILLHHTLPCNFIFLPRYLTSHYLTARFRFFSKLHKIVGLSLSLSISIIGVVMSPDKRIVSDLQMGFWELATIGLLNGWGYLRSSWDNRPVTASSVSTPLVISTASTGPNRWWKKIKQSLKRFLDCGKNGFTDKCQPILDALELDRSFEMDAKKNKEIRIRTGSREVFSLIADGRVMES